MPNNNKYEFSSEKRHEKQIKIVKDNNLDIEKTEDVKELTIINKEYKKKNKKEQEEASEESEEDKIINQYVNFQKGTKFERTTKEILIQDYKLNIIENKNYTKKKFYENEHYEFWIGGKVDGIILDDDYNETILEI